MEINEKIDKLISELDTATGMLIVAAMKDKTVRQAKEKIINVSFELGNLIMDIEQEIVIDNCRVRYLALQDGIDCGVNENGRCIGYMYDGELCEECKECAYSAIEEE